MEINLLDHGSISLIESLGTDDSIADAARVSYKRRKKKQNNEQLIDYLLRHQHTSPFEQVILKFYVKCPIFVARQWMRHRMSSINEISGRYTELEDCFYIPERDRLTTQDQDNKQASSTILVDDPDEVFNIIEDCTKYSHGGYQKLLDSGLSKELCRIILPLNQYTEFIWKIDLHNLMRFLLLRSDSHAQYEIRVYAEAIESIVSQLFPASYASYLNHIKEGNRISRDEKKVLLDALPNLGELINNSNLSDSHKREMKNKFGVN